MQVLGRQVFAFYAITTPIRQTKQVNKEIRLKLFPTFLIMHLITFVIYAIAISVFDKLDSEMLGFLFWGFLIFGPCGALILTTMYKPLFRSIKLTKKSCFLFIFLTELSFVNISDVLSGSKPLTWTLLISPFFKSDYLNFQLAISIHMAILISTLFATIVIIKDAYIKHH